MSNVDFALGTHTGWVRELNEDSHVALPKLGLWVIADGMGGHEAGEVASGIAIREIARSSGQGMPLAEAIESLPTVRYKPPPCKVREQPIWAQPWLLQNWMVHVTKLLEWAIAALICGTARSISSLQTILMSSCC